MYALWNQFKFGVGSDNPDKHHDMSRDRGSKRYLYSMYRRLGDLDALLINRGREVNEAIDSMYKHYGYKTQ